MKVVLSIILASAGSTRAFVQSSLCARKCNHKHLTSLSAKTAEAVDKQFTLPGVTEFENWFKGSCDDKNDNDTMKYVQHGMFSNGRGLEFIGQPKDVLSQDNAVITLPKDLVLKSVMVEDKEVLETFADDWDSVLSLQLLRECKKGKQSDIYG